MNMEKELGKIARRSSMSPRVKRGMISASIVSNLANLFAGGYKGALDAQGIDNNVMDIYPYLVLSNIITGAGTGSASRDGFLGISPVSSAIKDGILSPIEFAVGYGFGYIGTSIGSKVFS